MNPIAPLHLTPLPADPSLTGHMAQGPLLDASLLGAQRAVVFIDAQVPDLAKLLSEIGSSAEVVVLRADADGFEQMAQHLAGRNDLDAIHLVSHGSAGQIQAGDAWLDKQSLASYASTLARIGAALTDGGDLLIYGCDVAAGDDGAALLQGIAQATGADVAASTDVTGAARLGGNWTLESVVGVVATPALAAPYFDFTLAAFNEQFNSSWSTYAGTPFSVQAFNYTLGGTPFRFEFTSDAAGGSMFDAPGLGNAGTQGVMIGSYDGDLFTTERFVISRLDGQNFLATSLWFHNYDERAATIALYDDGVLLNSFTVASAMSGTVSFGNVNVDEIRLTSTNLYAVFDSFVGDSTPAPTVTITSATYSATTGVLTVTGTNMAAGNTIDSSKLTLTGEGGETHTLSSGLFAASNATTFAVTLNPVDAAAVGRLLNQNGTTSTSGTVFNLAAADDWNASATAHLTVDAINQLTVVDVVPPSITSATYDPTTGELTVTGTGFVSLAGAANDIDVSRLTLLGEGGEQHTLTSDDVEVTSNTQFTVVLNTADAEAVSVFMNKVGPSSTSGTAYNLLAAEDWAAGAAPAAVVVDLSNAVAVVGLSPPSITGVSYDAATGQLTVTGSEFLRLAGAANDIDVSKFTLVGEGGASRTLTSDSVEIASATSFVVQLNAADRAAVNVLFNREGTTAASGNTFGLVAAEDWAAGADPAVVVVDATENDITVTNVAVPTIDNAAFDAATGVLSVTGSGFLSLAGAANDIDTSRLQLVGEGGATRTLTTPGVDITSDTAFTVVLNAADRAAMTQFFNKNGVSATSGSVYNLVALEDWAAGAAPAVAVADASSALTISNAPMPTITSAAYDAATGTLIVTGANLLGLPGASNDIDASRITLSGEGGSYTLTTTPDVEITSGTQFTLVLSAADKLALATLLNKDGASSSGGATYNIAGLEDWNAGADPAAAIADAGANPVVVANADATPPTATLGVDEAMLSAGETTTLTVQFSEPVLGFAADDLNVPNASITGLASADGGRTWTATLTPDADTLAPTNAVSLDLSGVQDASGNVGIGTSSSNNYAVSTDITAPAFAAASVVGATLVLGFADTYALDHLNPPPTSAFSVVVAGQAAPVNAVAVDAVARTISLTLASAALAGQAVTVAYTDPTAADDAAAVQDTSGNDAASLAPVVVTNNTAPDALAPTATVVVADTELRAGETTPVTITFSEAVTGFALADLAAANGALSALATADSITWTATLTPAANTSDLTNTVTLNMPGVQDLSGNAGAGAVNSNNYAVRTLTPAATIAISDTQLRAGETAQVTITFDEPVTGLDAADLSVTGASLSAPATGDGGTTWTTTLTPTAAHTGGGHVITLNHAGVLDGSAQPGTGSTSSAAFSVDTRVPTVSIASSSASVPEGSSATITFTFSEAPVGFAAGDIAVSGGTLSGFAATGDARVFTALFTPTGASSTVAVSPGSYADAAGNAGAGATIAGPAAVAPQAPQVPTPSPGPAAGSQDGVAVHTVRVTGDSGLTTTTTLVAPAAADRVEDPATPNSTLADIVIARDEQQLPLVTVSLPTGVGVQAQSYSADNLSLREQLLQAARSTTAGAALDPQIEQDITAYLQVFGSATANATVRAIAFEQAASGATARPVLVTGSSATPHEALVIDVRGLPAGTPLVLNHVEFAIIVGDAHVVGGEGNNFVVAGGGNQFMVLGPGNDVISGGVGNDTLGSTQGGDSLNGGDGNDYLVGGEGNDNLLGGAGDDILQGGHSDAGTWTFQINPRGEVVSRFASANPELGGPGRIEHVGPWTSPGEARVTDARLGYAYEAPERLKTVALLHEAVTGSLPTLGDLNAFAATSLNEAALAQLAYEHHAAKAQLQTASIGQQVRDLIDTVWGAGSATDALVHEGEQFIAGGGSWADGLLVLARHERNTGSLTDAYGHLSLTRPWVTNELGWATEVGHDALYGGDGNDRLVGGAGMDHLDGGAGIDTAVFMGSASDYFIRKASFPGQVQLQIGTHGAELDVLVSIERLEIGGKTYTLSDSLVALATDVKAPLADHLVELVGLATAAGDVSGVLPGL